MSKSGGKFEKIDGKMIYVGKYKAKNLRRKLKAQGFKTIKGRTK